MTNKELDERLEDLTKHLNNVRELLKVAINRVEVYQQELAELKRLCECNDE